MKRGLYPRALAAALALCVICLSAGCAAKAPAPSSAAAQAENAPQLRLVIERRSVVTEACMPSESPEGDGTPYASVDYPRIELDEASAAHYPRLRESLDAWNEELETSALPTLADLADMAKAGLEDSWLNAPLYEFDRLFVGRADSRIVSFEVIGDGYYGLCNYARNYDPETGRLLHLSDVINGPDQIDLLAQAIFDHLEYMEEDYAFTEGESALILATIQSEIRDDWLTWHLSEEGFEVSFDTYELMYDAFGPIWATLSYEEYPELIAEPYRPDGKAAPLEERITWIEADPVSYSDEELSRYLADEGVG